VTGCAWTSRRKSLESLGITAAGSGRGRSMTAPIPATAKEHLVKNGLCALTLVAGLVVLVSPRAEAACISPEQRSGTSPVATRIAAPRTFAASQANGAVGSDASDTSIVGLWNTTFFAGDGPGIWDQAFEQWHSDGTELAVDNAVPPVLGNVCVGVWKQTGKTITLRHVTWNWDSEGRLAGTFQLLMTVAVDRRGRAFSGTYVSDSFDLAGNVIPELHAEGVVRGRRISVD
jgi:hypothetical protein